MHLLTAQKQAKRCCLHIQYIVQLYIYIYNMSSQLFLSALLTMLLLVVP